MNARPLIAGIVLGMFAGSSAHAAIVCWNDSSALFGRTWASGSASCVDIITRFGPFIQPSDDFRCYDFFTAAAAGAPAVVSGYHPTVDGSFRMGEDTGPMVDRTVYLLTTDSLDLRAVYRDSATGLAYIADLPTGEPPPPDAMSFLHINTRGTPAIYAPVPPFDSLPTPLIDSADFVVRRDVVDPTTLTLISSLELSYQFADLTFSPVAPAPGAALLLGLCSLLPARRR